MACNECVAGEFHTSAPHTNGQRDSISGMLMQVLEVGCLDAWVNFHCTGLKVLWRPLPSPGGVLSSTSTSVGSSLLSAHC